MSKHSIRKMVWLVCGVGLFLWLTVWQRPLHAADAVVGTGTAASCTEAAFNTALSTVQTSGGGTITFNCGGEATIPFTFEKSISTVVTIDGANQITLNGGNSTRLFLVFGGTLHLRNITLSNGFSNTNDGGAITNNGILTLDNTTIRDSRVSSNYSGGAIVNYGPLTITNSLFEDNVGGNGGALYLRFEAGGATITNSTFRHNQTTNVTNGWGGAILLWGADVTVRQSTFFENEARRGGAIHNLFDYAVVTLEPGNTFYNNRASDAGGALFVAGQTTIEDNTFDLNAAVNAGGAILSTVTANLTVTQSHFHINSSLVGGGINFSGIRLIVHDNVFDGNNANSEGGAIYISGGDLDVERTQFVKNKAVGNGGAIGCFNAFMSVILSGLAYNETIAGDGGAVYSTCSLNMSNLTLSDNKANGVNSVGGAIHQGGDVAAFIQYATIVDNTAVTGGGLSNGSNGSTITINKSIVAHNGGGNCSNGIGSAGYNLSNNGSCPSFTQTGDLQNATLPLAPFANNGGSTSSRLPLAGNQAVDIIPLASCDFATDQRGGTRPIGSGCDSGAVEVGGFVEQVYLPFVRK
ncbi:MAG: choice-of-anchor Q domain-containing protein [Chloroflexota bacterium]